MRFRITLFYFSWLLYHSLAGQSIDELTDSYLKAYPDEALRKIEQLLQDAVRSNDFEGELQLLEKRHQIAQWKYQSAKVIEDLDRRIFLSHKLGLEADLAELFLSKATFSARLGIMDEALALLDTLAYYLPVTPEEEILDIQIQTNYLKGRIYDRAGSLETAMKYYLQTIEDAEKIQKDIKIMDVYFQMGFINKALGNLDLAIENYEKSLEYGVRLEDTTYMVYNQVFIAGALLIQADNLFAESPSSLLEKAAQKLDQATALAADRDDPYEPELLYFEQSNYYEALGDLTKAIGYILKSRKESIRAQNRETEMASYVQAAECYNKAGMYEKAVNEANSGIELAKSIGAYYYLSDLYKELAISLENQGKVTRAFDYYKLYVEVKDSVFQEQTANRVNELQTLFEKEKKEAQIESLRQEAQIQALEIQQRNQAIYLTVATFSFILIVGLVFYRQRNLARKRKQVEIEQRFLRSQLNPHFISNALVTVQASLYEKDTEAALDYLETFSRLMREILENSREEFIYVEDEVMMVRDYLEINKKRLNNTFSYQVIVDESIEPEMDQIPPMFIQPFVENAIEYGAFEGKEGQISVVLSKSGDTIQIKVEDNGGGIKVDVPDTKNKRSLSTSIIRERIALYNESLKNKISLLIENMKDESGNIQGTRVALQVPTK